MTLDVAVTNADGTSEHGWALNEVAVEKDARERMLEVVVEIDGRPLSRWAGDGVVFATPTGSTAYAFSAGGPVVWPEVDALLLVPISAHALFARPLVTSPHSVLAVEVLPQSTQRCRVVRRPPPHRPLGRHPGRSDAGQGAGTFRAAPPPTVHRPAGGQVRAAGPGVARPCRVGRARCRPHAPRRRATGSSRCASRVSASSTTRRSSSGPASRWSPARPARARRWSCRASPCCWAPSPMSA